MWPCASFDLVFAEHERTGYWVCDCHTEGTVPAGAHVVARDSYIGSWAACADCRADVDADRWSVVRAQLMAEMRRLRVPTTYAGGLADGMQEMFKAHRTPPDEGSWQPYTSAAVDAETVAFNTTSGRS
jgi:hypothetical protein